MSSTATRHSIPGGDPAGEELGRFVVIVAGVDTLDVWLFDKQKQSDFMEKISVPITATASVFLGAVVVAWELEGMALHDY